MRSERVELVFILDRSGSMAGLEKETIGGYNALLEKQRREEGEALVTTVLFDHEFEIKHDRFDIANVKPMTEKEYFVRGMTALLDAVGRTLTMVRGNYLKTPESERPKKVLFVITTDGQENASEAFSYHQVKDLISEAQRAFGFEFLFLGANIDAIKVAEQMGIRRNHAANYHADAKGTALNFEAMSEAISYMRANNAIQDDWKAEIDKDFARRNKQRNE